MIKVFIFLIVLVTIVLISDITHKIKSKQIIKYMRKRAEEQNRKISNLRESKKSFVISLKN